MTCVGIISDTHGLIRPEALAALGGCDLIIHAGDVGSPDVLDRLREIAPVIAVRGKYRALGTGSARRAGPCCRTLPVCSA
jgi:predicted phosphodiesterase